MTDQSIPWTTGSDDFDSLWRGSSDLITVPDMLATIFTQQRSLMRAVWEKEIASGLSIPTTEEEWGTLGARWPTEIERRVQGRIHETFGHLVRELSEAMAHLDGSKSWKDKPRATDVDEFHEEIADALHFFVEFCILAGVDAESLFRAYFAKALINTDRVENGY